MLQGTTRRMALLVTAFAACGGGGRSNYPDPVIGGTGGNPAGTGGSNVMLPGSGGRNATGGDVGGTGGAGGVGTGGALSTGGTHSSGGQTDGGALGSGGLVGSGGTRTGGGFGTGGSLSGGGVVGAGGATATGGTAVGTGGVLGTGGGAPATGGTTGAGGAWVAPPAGTVLAVDLDGTLVIQTGLGPAFFSAIGACFGVSVGNTVVFKNSSLACAINEFTVSGTQTSCMVFCDGTGYAGTVVSSSNDADFVISTTWGSQLFQAKTLCFGVLPGDKVVFEDSTGACVSNSFVDLRAGRFCDVWCD